MAKESKEAKIIIHPSHVKVFKFVDKYLKKKLFAPQLDEISKGVELTTRQVVRLVDDLVELGFLGKEPFKKRSLCVLRRLGE